MPLSVADPARPEQPYNPGQRRTWISRTVLLAILLMQAMLSLRLHNTAFEDEAQYLYPGGMEIQYLFHHIPLRARLCVVLLRGAGALPGAGRRG